MSNQSKKSANITITTNKATQNSTNASRQLVKGRCLTANNEAVANRGHDNARGEYILYENDVIGRSPGCRYRVLDILGHGTFGQVAKCRLLPTPPGAPEPIVKRRKNRSTKSGAVKSRRTDNASASGGESNEAEDDDADDYRDDVHAAYNDDGLDDVGKNFAVKVVKNRPAYLNQGFVEIQILELLNKQIDPDDNCRIVRLADYFVFRKHLCLVFELLSVNLYELVKQNQFRGISLRLTRTFIAQLLKALSALARSNIIHCDLKPENILLESLSSPKIKLIDFGSACFEGQTVYSYIQSRFYRSPEVLLGIPYTRSIDLWSLGCIAAELFLGLPLFPGSSEYDQMRRIVKMRDLPPPAMLRRGKSTHKFFIRTAPFFDYRLKTASEFTAATGIELAPPKRYLKHDTIADLVAFYPYKRTWSAEEVAAERSSRDSYVHFLHGLLTVSPTRRWTADEALLHPFITGEPLPSNGWKPARSKSKKSARPKKSDEAKPLAQSDKTTAATSTTVATAATTATTAGTDDKTKTDTSSAVTSSSTTNTNSTTTTTATTTAAAATTTTPTITKPDEQSPSTPTNANKPTTDNNATPEQCSPSTNTNNDTTATSTSSTSTKATSSGETKTDAAPVNNVADGARTGMLSSAPAQVAVRHRAITSSAAVAASPSSGEFNVPRSQPMAMPKSRRSTMSLAAPIASSMQPPTMSGFGDGGVNASQYAAHALMAPPGTRPVVAQSYPPVAGSELLHPFGAAAAPAPPHGVPTQAGWSTAAADASSSGTSPYGASSGAGPYAAGAHATAAMPVPGGGGGAVRRRAPWSAATGPFRAAYIFGSPPSMTSQPRSYQASAMFSPPQWLGTPRQSSHLGSSGAGGSDFMFGSFGAASGGAYTPRSTTSSATSSKRTTPVVTPITTRRRAPTNDATSPTGAAAPAAVSRLASTGSSSGKSAAPVARRVSSSSSMRDSGNDSLVFELDDDSAAAGSSPGTVRRRGRSSTGHSVDGVVDADDCLDHLTVGSLDIGQVNSPDQDDDDDAENSK